MPIRVAIISPHATVVPHFETELDIAQQHLDAGDEISFLNCFGDLKNCDHNIEKSERRCHECVGRREMGLELLTPRSNDQLVKLETFNTDHSDRVQLDFETLDDLINYKIDDFDIGYAALSSLVSVCRDPEPDLIAYRETLNDFLISAWQTYEQTLAFLQANSIDRVYAFNGRFAPLRGALRACQKLKVDCFLHERGCDGDHYQVFKNHLPHDIAAIEVAIDDCWEAATQDPEREAVANSWFQDRVDRVEKVWHSFVKEQKKGRLPETWNPSQKNIAIFCSSDDEFVAIGGEWRNELYPNQATAVKQIAEDMLRLQPETHLYVRVHPNLRDVDNQRLRDMLELKSENLTIIPPAAEIDTYELMRKCDTVVSFGSSVGIEATFWDKPSVLLGPCFYRNLGGVYRSHSHSQTLELLAKSLEPLGKSGALKYGFWFQTRGQRHQYFEATDLFEGQFKGQTLYARPPKLDSIARLKKNAKQILTSLLPGK